jgi:hypothetical protein
MTISRTIYALDLVVEGLSLGTAEKMLTYERYAVQEY